MRPGHHRPLGTTTTMRFEWDDAPLPELGDVLAQESASGVCDFFNVGRWYRVVGILEGRVRSRFRLVLERVECGTPPDEGRTVHGFYNLPRR